MGTPFIVLDAVRQACAQAIQVNVRDCLSQIIGCETCLLPVSPLDDVSHTPAGALQQERHSPQQWLHEMAERAGALLNEQVNVVRHDGVPDNVSVAPYQ